MTTDIERPFSDRSDKSARSGTRLLGIVGLGALVLLAESMVIVLLVMRASLRLQSPAVYLLPVLVPLPALEGLSAFRDMRRQLSLEAEPHKSGARGTWGLFATVLYSYVALIFVLIAFMDYVHKSAV